MIQIPEINFVFSGQIRNWNDNVNSWLEFSEQCEDHFNCPVYWYGHGWGDNQLKTNYNKRLKYCQIDDQQIIMRDWINERFLHRIMYSNEIRDLVMDTPATWLEKIYEITIPSFGQHLSFALALAEFSEKSSNTNYLGCKVRWDMVPVVKSKDELNRAYRVYECIYNQDQSIVVTEPSADFCFTWGREYDNQNLDNIIASTNETSFYFNSYFAKEWDYPITAFDAVLSSYYHNQNRYDTHMMWFMMFAKFADVIKQREIWPLKLSR